MQAERHGVADEDDVVVGWRYEQLLTAGVRPALALCLADDPRFDLHRLIDLIEQGCPAPLAVRILAPDEPEEPCAP